jgi:hypothetical protein
LSEGDAFYQVTRGPLDVHRESSPWCANQSLPKEMYRAEAQSRGEFKEEK